MSTPVSPDYHECPPPKKRVKSSDTSTKEPELVLSLRRLDPILQFLSRATGKATIPLATLQAALPGNDQQKQQIMQHIPELVRRAVLHTVNHDIGFPPPPSLADTAEHAQAKKTTGTLHGCTKASAKRRLAALNRSLKSDPGLNNDCSTMHREQGEKVSIESRGTAFPQKEWTLCPPEDESDNDSGRSEEVLEEEKEARHALETMFKFASRQDKVVRETDTSNHDSLSCILPKQASYAGSNPARTSSYGSLSSDVKSRIPFALLDAFGLERDGTIGRRRLYQHQAAAIDSAMRSQHTLVCTGTGSGKSLCFLLPVLAAAMNDQDSTSLLMFPTKALAQDQMTKLEALIQDNPALKDVVRPGVIDGDTPHQFRSTIAQSCNVILTNPDTLHAAILPGWKRTYRPLLERSKYIVIDETHMYEGVFGAHVALVLSRLMRLCAVCSVSREIDSSLQQQPQVTLPTFLACSATMSHPEHHFRLLCPISRDASVKVLKADDDGSPRSSKHFFVWNPPVMNVNGTSTGRVTISKSCKREARTVGKGEAGEDRGSIVVNDIKETEAINVLEDGSRESQTCRSSRTATGGKELYYRRHAADETALLLAKAVKNKVRCIAFCKTRSLVEWVFERTISALRADPETKHLVARVESYRGGYSVEERRLIEQRLFNNDLLAVVGTSALELGVDIGGINITLHCGYPSSHSSLLQQAGRAGRCSARLDVPSLAVMICFNSPSEQHMWRHPKNLLNRGLSVAASVPVNVGLVEGHLLCAGEEYPLTGEERVTILQCCSEMESFDKELLNDCGLLGAAVNYTEAVDVLVSAGSLVAEVVPLSNHGPCKNLKVYTTHPSIQKPWSRISLRSIEPINYSIVDASHPLQGGRMDILVDEKAILDTIPYSRVFYHAFPGAVITHRGRRYKVVSMTRPPPFASSIYYRSSCNLAAFAKPTTVKYSTRPLSGLTITVVKQMERIDLVRDTLMEGPSRIDGNDDFSNVTNSSLAGSGIVTVKRTVHGYKKLSLVTRAELSRTEISLPPMEFDTYGLWIDAEATVLSSIVKDYNEGVHALSHAILAVAPLFVPCASSDLECDHKSFECSRVMVFDLRAGGAGTCSQLWKFLFMPDGLLDTALSLLQNCPSCSLYSDYQGGCPACIQSGQCLKFNQDLSRSAGVLVAKRMLERIKQTSLYKRNCELQDSGRELNDAFMDTGGNPATTADISSPRRKARAAKLRDAKKLKSARKRDVVVGRPSWPMDEIVEGKKVE